MTRELPVGTVAAVLAEVVRGVAVADLAGGAVVVTVDPADLGMFACYASNVDVTDIGA
ncbi:MAG: hypothetical protein ACRDYZ_10015 [Acidimicrobiales bacterium]